MEGSLGAIPFGRTLAARAFPGLNTSRGRSGCYFVLGVAIWFTITLGTYVSLVSQDSRQASSRTLVPVLLLSLSFLACYMPARFTTVFMGLGSAPFVNWLCIVTYGEIANVMSGDDTFRPLQEMGILTYESPTRVLALCLISVVGFALAAFYFGRAAFERFEQVSGRALRCAGIERARRQVVVATAVAKAENRGDSGHPSGDGDHPSHLVAADGNRAARRHRRYRSTFSPVASR